MGSLNAKRSCAGGALATGLGALAISLGGASTAMAADCGNYKPIAKNVTAKNVTCKKAKAVIQAWAVGVDNGYTCEGDPRVVCRKGDAVVKFTAQ